MNNTAQYPGTDAEMISTVEHDALDFLTQETDPHTGLVADSTVEGSDCSIAAVGLGLTAYPCAVERGWMTRDEATRRTLTVLRFLWASQQGPEGDATGYKGFYYHFLDMKHGRRAGSCELSTIDTALLMAGVLLVSEYFSRDTRDEGEVRELAQKLYARVDWQWACDGQATLTHGWTPEAGFLPHRWDNGYSEAHILYVLALGSPTFPIAPEGYRAWTKTFTLESAYGQSYLSAAPLFIHQMSQVWLDFRGVRDEAMRAVGFDYFESSRRATVAQRAYAIENPLDFAHYGENCWGFTASNGPGPVTLEVGGRQRQFFGYIARGAPHGIDDGTVAPWAVVASMPFAPDLTLPTIRHAIERLELHTHHRVHGFDASFNPTYPERSRNPNGWVSPHRLGLDQGPIVAMIENHRSGLIWKTMGKSPHIVTGLERAGFRPTGT